MVGLGPPDATRNRSRSLHVRAVPPPAWWLHPPQTARSARPGGYAPVVADLLRGVGCLPRALRLLAGTPRLWRYVLVPIGLNLVVGVTVYAALLVAGLRAIDDLVASLALPGVLALLLQAALVVVLLVATGFVLVRFGVVLGSPWYGRLSEEIERMRGVAVPSPARGLLGGLARSLAFEAKKLLLVAVVGLPLLLLNVVPGLGSAVAAAGGLALAAVVACLDFLDPPLERRGLGFRAELGYARRTLPGSAGFGVACALLLAVPFLNLLLVPLCVTAGTIFFCDRAERPGVRA
jgi:CysZ protein